MAKKKKKIIYDKNYLDRIPVRLVEDWKMNEDTKKVTLYIKNTGLMKKITQVLFFKPKVSQIHLDENGSFIWPLIDGEKSIFDIGELVKEHFGEKAEPLHPRLVKYFEILRSYNFVAFKDELLAAEEKKNKKAKKSK